MTMDPHENKKQKQRTRMETNDSTNDSHSMGKNRMDDLLLLQRGSIEPTKQKKLTSFCNDGYYGRKMGARERFGVGTPRVHARLSRPLQRTQVRLIFCDCTLHSSWNNRDITTRVLKHGENMALKQLQLRIVSTQNIEKITASMKMVAAAKMKGTENRLFAGRPFGMRTCLAAFPQKRQSSTSLTLRTH